MEALWYAAAVYVFLAPYSVRESEGRIIIICSPTPNKTSVEKTAAVLKEREDCIVCRETFANMSDIREYFGQNYGGNPTIYLEI